MALIAPALSQTQQSSSLVMRKHLSMFQCFLFLQSQYYIHFCHHSLYNFQVQKSTYIRLENIMQDFSCQCLSFSYLISYHSSPFFANRGILWLYRRQTRNGMPGFVSISLFFFLIILLMHMHAFLIFITEFLFFQFPCSFICNTS